VQGYNEFSLLSLSCSDYLSLPSVGIQIKVGGWPRVGVGGEVGLPACLPARLPACLAVPTVAYLPTTPSYLSACLPCSSQNRLKDENVALSLPSQVGGWVDGWLHGRHRFWWWLLLPACACAGCRGSKECR